MQRPAAKVPANICIAAGSIPGGITHSPSCAAAGAAARMMEMTSPGARRGIGGV